jgi:hypothetical protein
MDHQADPAESPGRDAFFTQMIGPIRGGRKTQQPEVQPAWRFHDDHDSNLSERGT